VFLYTVKPGPANQSYGLQVARLAGIPQDVIAAANRKLLNLEAHYGEDPSIESKTSGQLRLFEPPCGHEVLNALLANVDPDDTTPQRALELLYQIKRLMY